MKKILLIDNYDSFTYNLAHLLEEIEGVELTVTRNKNIPKEVQSNFDGVLLSPGPGIPEEAGDLITFLKEHIDKLPILGVCLGHQAIAEVLGGKLKNTRKVYHGVSTNVINHRNNDGILKELGEEFQAGRYHSWIVDQIVLPEALEVTASIKDGTIMAFAHRELPVYGVQFHPESILTPNGKKILENWVKGISSNNQN